MNCSHAHKNNSYRNMWKMCNCVLSVGECEIFLLISTWYFAIILFDISENLGIILCIYIGGEMLGVLHDKKKHVAFVLIERYWHNVILSSTRVFCLYNLGRIFLLFVPSLTEGRMWYFSPNLACVKGTYSFILSCVLCASGAFSNPNFARCLRWFSG